MSLSRFEFRGDGRVNDRLPILDLSRAYAEIRDEVRGALERVFEAQSFILGREVRTFEEHVESYLELLGENGHRLSGGERQRILIPPGAVREGYGDLRRPETGKKLRAHTGCHREDELQVRENAG